MNSLKMIKIKNIIYPIIIIVMVFFVYSFTFLMLGLDSDTINAITYENSLFLWWILFVFIYGFIFTLYSIIDAREYNKNLIILFCISIIASMFLSIINVLIVFSIGEFYDKMNTFNSDNQIVLSTWDVFKFTFLQIIYYLIIFIGVLFYSNFLISSSLKNFRILEFLNSNFVFFIFNRKIKIEIEDDKYLHIFNDEIFFTIYFLELNSKETITFEYEVIDKNRNSSQKIEEKLNDFFSEFENQVSLEENKIKDVKIIPDSNLVSEIKEKNTKKSQNFKESFSILLYSELEDLNITGKPSKNFMVINDREVIYEIKKILKKGKKQNGK